jgi:hypothetical protein
MLSRKLAAIPLLFVIACLGGCGGDDDGTRPPAATYTIGGQLSGLESGASVTLRNNGADDLTLTANGSFTFGVAIADGNTYDVTVLTSPAEHGCTVTNGAGTVQAADVSDVAITCTLTPRGLFSPAASLSVARTGHSATMLTGGKVLVVGGYGAAGASAELYDPVANTWSMAGTPATARVTHAVTLLANGKVLVAGGWYGGPLGSAELYDPGTNAWSLAGDLTVAHYEHTAILLATGKVLVAGGWYNMNATANAELYDPGTNSWTPATNMAIGLTLHSATALADGRVLMVGGLAEIYDVDTGTRSMTGNPLVGRMHHTTTLLPDTKVLVVGGYGDGVEQASVELYW